MIAIATREICQAYVSASLVTQPESFGFDCFSKVASLFVHGTIAYFMVQNTSTYSSQMRAFHMCHHDLSGLQ